MTGSEDAGRTRRRDEPARFGDVDDHAELLSELTSHDLALPSGLTDPTNRGVFEFDESADPDEMFPQSVASGGPTPSGVVLWTRLDPDEVTLDDPVGVEVATDPAFEDVTYRAVVDDPDRIAAHDYTLKADLMGVLDADSEYYYRFVHGGVTSRTGRCRTLPERGASPGSVRFAVVACQNLANGYFGAYHHIAEEDVDFIVHVGDFIYESANGAFTTRWGPDLPDRHVDLPSGADRVQDLEDYRYIHRTYRSDRFLQEALESHTLIAGWDDHEIANDLYWDDAADAPRADHPRGDDPEFMTHLVADAIHAWWEYMPARVQYNPGGDRLQERFRLWREFRFGDLLTLSLTDERLFRDPPNEGVADWVHVDPADEPEGRTMLGEDQRDWLLDRLVDADTRWTVWADEVLTPPFRLGAGPLSVYPVQGGWDGYTRERKEIYETVADADVENFVTLTGDMHCYIAGYHQTEYADLIDRLRGRSPGERLGVELMTPAMTSLNVAEAVGLTWGPLGTVTEPLLRRLVTAFNPHVEFFDSHHWGYSVVEFTREDCTYVGYSVDKTENSPHARKETVAAFRVPAGETDLEDVTDDY